MGVQHCSLTVADTTMNILIAVSLAVLGIVAAEPGYRYYGHGYGHGYSHGYGHGYGHYGKRSAEAEPGYGYGHGYGYGGYGHGYGHGYGKRSADAEPKAD